MPAGAMAPTRREPFITGFKWLSVVSFQLSAFTKRIGDEFLGTGPIRAVERYSDSMAALHRAAEALKKIKAAPRALPGAAQLPHFV